MFGELPKLFDKNFAYGFFLPFATFIAISLGIADRYGYLTLLLTYIEGNILLGTTVIGLVSWLGGILLLAVNRDIIRFLEGYGPYNPFLLFKKWEENRYHQLTREVEGLDDQIKAIEAADQKPASAEYKRLNRIWSQKSRQLVIQFPDHPGLLLPTSFGNIIRSFEVYSRVMYGLDSIPGWTLLTGVIPPTFLEQVNSAKARMNFWINLGVVSLLILIQLIVVASIYRQVYLPGIPVAVVFFCWITYHRASSAAVQWGEQVKAAFDVFLPDLAAKMKYKLPEDHAGEFEMWQKFSGAVIYRLPQYLPARTLEEKPEQVNEFLPRNMGSTSLFRSRLGLKKPNSTRQAKSRLGIGRSSDHK